VTAQEIVRDPALPQLAAPKRAWTRWLSQGVSVALLAGVLFQLRHVSPTELREALPDTPLFLPALLALYLTQPLADWVIFRRLWRLPPSGFPILVGKRIANELLMYSGEAYFYLWARRQGGLAAAPFGAIKDVNILSALIGNLLALALLLCGLPFFQGLELGAYAQTGAVSAAAMLAVSVTVFMLSRRLFTLTRDELFWVSWIHLGRLIAGVLLWALLGRLALPEAPTMLWLALSVVRLLVARLPLAPHKDLLFAGVAALLVGGQHSVVAFVAMLSLAILLLHLIFGAAFACGSLLLGDSFTGRRTAAARL
jgi:hypothetical protein